MDDTEQKIIDATMELVRDKGYVATTTKDIAKMAGVNECTLFRKFAGKKEIVVRGIGQEKWRANVSPDIFKKVTWDLATDLKMFMREYMERITPDFVNLSIGLRAPQLYEETAPLIMKVPAAFMTAIIDYFEKMHERGKIMCSDFESLAMSVFSSTFGYTFLNAVFGQSLTKITPDEFIESNAEVLAKGILQSN